VREHPYAEIPGHPVADRRRQPGLRDPERCAEDEQPDHRQHEDAQEPELRGRAVDGEESVVEDALDQKRRDHAHRRAHDDEDRRRDESAPVRTEQCGDATTEIRDAGSRGVPLPLRVFIDAAEPSPEASGPAHAHPVTITPPRRVGSAGMARHRHPLG